MSRSFREFIRASPSIPSPWAPRASNRRKQRKLPLLTVKQINCYLCWCLQHNSFQLEHVDYLHNFSLNNFTAIWDTVDLELLALRTTPLCMSPPFLLSLWCDVVQLRCLHDAGGFANTHPAMRSADGPADTAPAPLGYQDFADLRAVHAEQPMLVKWGVFFRVQIGF